jgi:hypothetical protein
MLLVVGAVVGLIVVGALREREPEYGGKRLSEWVEKTSCFVEGSFGKNLVVTPPEAVDPIRHIGSNALPCLLEWIRYDPPAWKTRLFTIINNTFHCRLEDKRLVRADGATTGLIILGNKAHGAIPRLALLMSDTRTTNTAVRATWVLALMRCPFEGNDPSSAHAVLVSLLSHPDPGARMAATNALARIRPQALQLTTP